MFNENAIGFVGSNMGMGIVGGMEMGIVCVLEIDFGIVDHVVSNDRGFGIVGDLKKIIISFRMFSYLHDGHHDGRLSIPCRNQVLDCELAW